MLDNNIKGNDLIVTKTKQKTYKKQQNKTTTTKRPQNKQTKHRKTPWLNISNFSLASCQMIYCNQITYYIAVRLWVILV